MGITNLKTLFENEYGVCPEIKNLTGGGSGRRYFRLSDSEYNVIGVINDDDVENKIFIDLAEFLSARGINVPKIITVSKDKKIMLLQDLGDTMLLDLLKGEDKINLSKRALSDLIHIQLIPQYLWSDKTGFPQFSERLVRWDLNYFKYDFLKPLHIAFDEEKLEDDFDKLTKKLMSPDVIYGLMYRDFQSRNIMVKDGNLWYIDFQGARKVPVVYYAV